MSVRKILVIGVDGVDPDLVEKLVAEGRLPNFAKFINEGAFGRLESTIPSLTPVAWTSMLSGLNPGRHGILGFVRYLPDSRKLKILNSKDRRGKTLWHYLNQAGKKVGLLNYPALYPPEEIDGFLVSGMLTPSINCEFTYPVVLREELLGQVRGYDIDINAVKHGKNKEVFLKKIYELTGKRLEATKYLMKKKPWDFFFTVITESDRLGHFFWRNERAMGDYFDYLDKVVGEIMDAAPPEATVFLVSDHGMGEVLRKFYVSEFLAKNGFLTFKSSSLTFISRALFHKVANLAVGTLTRLGVDVEKIKGLLPPGLMNKAVILYGYPEGIDWKKTRCWFAPGMGEGLVVNLAGRQPDGVVDPADYERVRNEVIQKLSQFRDPQTGQKVVASVYKREEIYRGEVASEAADLILRVADGYTTIDGRFGGRLLANVVEEDICGEHRLSGIIGALGPAIRKCKIEGAKIIDIAPTVLELMGVRGAEEMDGRSFKKCLT